MFGINDPAIWLAYVLGFACLLFSVWFGVTHWNKDDKNDKDDHETPSAN